MDTNDLKELVKDIVAKADEMKQRLVREPTPVNYACIFCQSDDEYILFLKLAKQLGTVVQETAAGPVFYIEALPTVAGNVRLLKIRRPDFTRLERGDADFTLSNYTDFKKQHLNQECFKIIDKGNFEMIEYRPPKVNVVVYFSNPTLAEVLKIS